MENQKGIKIFLKMRNRKIREKIRQRRTKLRFIF